MSELKEHASSFCSCVVVVVVPFSLGVGASTRGIFCEEGSGALWDVAGVWDCASVSACRYWRGIAEVGDHQWFVSPGDSVRQFDKICEVQSDKATVEITSRFDGVIKSVEYGEGDMAAVGTTLVNIETDEDEGAPLLRKVSAAPTSVAPSPTVSSDATRAVRKAASGGSGKVLTTPAVRRLARGAQSRSGGNPGNGKGGRIMKSDVIEFMAAAKSGSPAPASSAPSATPSPAAATSTTTIPTARPTPPPRASALAQR